MTSRTDVRERVRSWEVVDLALASLDQLTRVYARVFAGAITFEAEKCRWCGWAYPGPAASRPTPDATYPKGTPCWNPGCRRPLELMSFYEDPAERLAERIIGHAIEQEAFAGLVAHDFTNGPVGFSWGYRLPAVDSPAVKFSSTIALLADRGLDPGTTFYAAETGVLLGWRRVGVARRLAAARLRAAMAMGFSQVCFRTVDRKRVLGLYEALLGPGRVRELFVDPDPTKVQTWFGADLDGLAQSGYR